ncbi:polysaccharide deacetylase [Paenibacillus piscarius]|uniref:polysaccharide deacetylase n=1 Tax=Paenibacillus piscarius TaxID=1089681 RepID=UPI001EE96DB5|nr:polysaccharide deacetylase [Paenibacillus piscarius]
MMKGSLGKSIRRMVICGLLVIAVVLSVGVSAYEGRGNLSALQNTVSRQAEAGKALPLLSKNNPPTAPVQELRPEASGKAALQPQKAHIQALSAKAAAPAPAAQGKKNKVVYLTFDDGPSAVTPEVLSILQQQGVKGTFFMLGEQAAGRPELVNAVYNQGHAIGNHTYNHNYHDLYSGFTEFWRQIKQTEKTVLEITGFRPQLVRAPGGTFDHFDNTYFGLLKQAGYTVMDWTVDSGDSRRRGVPAAEILRNSAADLSSPRVVVLLHDGSGHEQSAKALPAIIERYKAAGYEFGLLDAQSEPVQFRVSAKAAALHRAKPSEAWITANIVPNAALVTPGKALALEVGGAKARLEPGEYRVEDGQYVVPLRTAVERLGGAVGWNAEERSGTVLWNGRSLTLDSVRQEISIRSQDGKAELIPASVQLIDSSLWVPLRALLEAAGHPPVEATVHADVRIVKAA